MRPLYLMVGFWGDRFRSYFIEYCLPSLLAPRNLGALSANDGHRFLICTTAADWQALQDKPAWQLLKAHATPVHIEVGLPENSSDEAKFKHMTLGHRLLVRAVHEHRALACQIMPDTMYTDGTIETVLRHAAAGAHAVLAVAMRFREEGLFHDLRQLGLLPNPRVHGARTSRAIALQPRSVVGPAIQNLFRDCMTHDWESRSFPMWPTFCFWRVAQRSEMLIHSAYYAYILLDMSAVRNHNERSFDVASIENFWLADNFSDPDRIHVLQDSDDAMVISWTPDAPFQPTERLIARLPVISTLWKGFRFRYMREYLVSIGDPHKAHNLRYPIRLHAGDIDAEWQATELRAHRIMLWFFGDVFREYAAGLRWPSLKLMQLWWLFLRASIRARSPVEMTLRQIGQLFRLFFHRLNLIKTASR